MHLKEVAEAGEQSNGLDVVRLGTYIDGAEFVFPRLDALGVSVNPKWLTSSFPNTDLLMANKMLV